MKRVLCKFNKVREKLLNFQMWSICTYWLSHSSDQIFLKIFFFYQNFFPRSILTIPWIELGGTVTITCAKTGYHADIDFLTKPFYGGKRNKITAEVYAPNEKKSFLSVFGEWSGLMESKYNSNDGNKQVNYFHKKFAIIADLSI